MIWHSVEGVKSCHEKVRKIVHDISNEPQLYLTSVEFTNAQKSILFNLGCSCKNNFRYKFYNIAQNSICQLCKLAPDSQQHALICPEISKYPNNEEIIIKSNVNYTYIFGGLPSQQLLRIVKIFQSIITIKKRLLASRDPHAAYPGTNSGPCG